MRALRSAIFATVILMLFAGYVNGQDRIIMRDRDTLNVQITDYGADGVKFRYSGENVINFVRKAEIRTILYESGRVVICNDFKEIPKTHTRADWEKVLVTFEPLEIAGLVDCGKVSEKSGWGCLFSVPAGKKVIRKMQKDAAEKGAGIILITSGWHKEKDKPLSGYGRGVKIGGVAYRQ